MVAAATDAPKVQRKQPEGHHYFIIFIFMPRKFIYSIKRGYNELILIFK